MAKKFFACLVIVIVAVLIYKGTIMQNNSLDDLENLDNLDNSSYFDNSTYIKEIDAYAQNIYNSSGEWLKRDGLITANEFGSDIDEFLMFFDTLGEYSNINILENKFVEIIPASDFLDIQSYYYKDNNLVLYERDFIGIGGFAKYYFKDGNLIEIVTEVEPEMNFTPENMDDILKRATNNYNLGI